MTGGTPPERWTSHRFPMPHGVLIDLSGVVYSGSALLPGAVEAMKRLEAAGLPYRFLTNTTRRSLRAIHDQLSGFGLGSGLAAFSDAKSVPTFAENASAVDRAHIVTPAAVSWLDQHGHAPHLLIHPDLEENFAACRKDGPEAVVVGDAGRFFTYERLNAAFRLLHAGAPFIALAANRVFKDDDGALSMDAGAFVEALRFSSGAEPILMGKPAPAFFQSAAASMGLGLADVAMIGDDAEADVSGALEAGAGMATLVKTGKYRQGDEERAALRPTTVVAGISEVVLRGCGFLIALVVEFLFALDICSGRFV